MAVEGQLIWTRMMVESWWPKGGTSKGHGDEAEGESRGEGRLMGMKRCSVVCCNVIVRSLECGSGARRT